LRERLWREDGLFDSVISPLVISYDDDDDDNYENENLFSPEENEYEVDDNVPYADDQWYMDDGIDLEGPQFAKESEYWDHMMHGPPPKRARIIPV